VIAPSRGAAYRRFYLYSALSIAVIATAVGCAILLRLGLQSFGLGVRPSSDEASRSISLAIALLAVAVPVGAIHLWLILRSLRDPAERADGIRHQYLNLWLAVALLVVLFAGQAAVGLLIYQDGTDVTIQGSVLVVAAIVGAIAASWISRTPPASPHPRVRTAVVVMLVTMAVAAFSIANAASGAGGLFQDARLAGPAIDVPFRGPPAEFIQRSQEQAVWSGLLICGLALMVWAFAFAWQRRWPESRDRIGYALIGYGLGTLLLLVGASFAIAGAVRFGSDVTRVSAFTTAWPPTAAGALLILVHATLLLRDRGRNGHPPVTTTRLLLAVPALVGLGMIVGGLGFAWRAVLEREVAPTQLVADYVTQGVALLGVGTVAYVPSWTAFARRTTAESAVRRFYLFTVVCLALAAGLVSGVVVLYNAITSIAQVGEGDAARTALTWLVPTAALAAIFASHLVLLLRDQRVARVAEPAPATDPLTALLEDVRAGRVSVERAAATIRGPGA
jgi:hypothetical protein